jgi:histidine triad (HIT) family protein
MNLAPLPPMNPTSCPFCRIIQGELPAEILYRDDSLICFIDARPITPVHILIVPLEHIESLNAITSAHQELLGHMILTAKDLIPGTRLERSGYRLVINTGPDAGQSVFHLHLHLIGGRAMPFIFNYQ